VGLAVASALVLTSTGTVVTRAAGGNACFPLPASPDGCLYTPTTFNLPVRFPALNFDYSVQSYINYDGTTLSVAGNTTNYWDANGNLTSIAGDSLEIGGGGTPTHGIVNMVATVDANGGLVIGDHDACGDFASSGLHSDFCVKGYVVGGGSNVPTVLLRGVILNFLSSANHPVVGFPNNTTFNAYDFYIKLTGGTLRNAVNYQNDRLAVEVASPLVWNQGGNNYQGSTFYCGDAAFRSQFPTITQWLGNYGVPADAPLNSGACGDGTFHQKFVGVDIIGIAGSTDFLDGMLQYPPPADLCNGTISGSVLDGLLGGGLDDSTVTVAGGDLDAAEQRTTLANGAWAVTSTAKHATGLCAGTYTVTATPPATDYFANDGYPSSVAFTVTADSAGNDTVTPSPVNFKFSEAISTDYWTASQGAWGANPNPRRWNVGNVLHAYYSAVYGADPITIGGPKSVMMYCPYAVQRFLPQNGKPGALSESYLDDNCTTPFKWVGGPLKFGKKWPHVRLGSLAGETLALQLNVDFSKSGVTRTGLENLYVTVGKFKNKQVKQVLATANAVLGGGALPANTTYDDVEDTAELINKNFEGGRNRGFLSPTTVK
jgi:hypothetical protein